jgi:ABC-type polysaccharide/polyol phosphate transport system ATPase subunit
MPSNVLVVQNLTKEYLLSSSNAYHQTLTGFLKNPFKKEPKQLFSALKEVSFSLESGDRLAVIGRNGAGKSTLLKVLSKVTTPTRGHIVLNGKVSSLLEVGTGFHGELTGRENIFLSGSILGMKRKEILKKFDEIVAFSEVEPFLDMPVKHYSSGMLTRLGFSVGAHLDPDLMIVDEVLAVGDASFQEKCFLKMKALGDLGKTFLFVSHNEAFLRRFCTKGLLLDKGQNLFFGDLSSCLNKYHEMIKPLKSSWEGVLEGDGVIFRSVVIREEKMVLLYDFDSIESNVFFEIALFNSRGAFIGRSNILPKLGKGCQMLLPLPINHLETGEYTLSLNAHKHNQYPLFKEPIFISLSVLNPLGASYFDTGFFNEGILLSSQVVFL